MRSPRRGLAAALAFLALLGGTVLLDAVPASAAVVTFTVNSLADASDASPGNGTCATATSVCTLRAAIEEANVGSVANTYTINFGVAGTIQLGTKLQDLQRAITVDAATAPGYSVAGGPVVVVNCGSQTAAATAQAFPVLASDVTVRGFRIVNCHTAIATATTTANLRVVGNVIGSDGSSFAAGNAVDTAISLVGPNAVVGGPNPADRNVISGFLARGIVVFPTATGATIAGNHVGTNRSGSAAIRNPAGNVDLTTGTTTGASMAIQTAAPNTTIQGNVISGNPGWGVQVASTGAVLKGNTIGLDATGTTGLGNFGFVISIDDGATATIGGTGPGDGNVIADVRRVAGTASYAGRYLISVYGSTATVVGNKIGTNATGTAAVGDAGGFLDRTVGISSVASGSVSGSTVRASNVTIGGSAPGAGNVIAGRYYNVELASYPGQTFLSTATVQGNLIGTNATGTAAIAGSDIGIKVAPYVAATIGGTASGAGNVVSGHDTGIEVTDNNAGVVIQGNKIGTDLAGSASIANATSGLEIVNDGIVPTDAGGPQPLVGGSAAGAGNLISGNGIRALTTGRPGKIQGNRIGTNAAGTAAIPNGRPGSNPTGVVTLSAPGLLFGGTGPGEGNLVSGNNGSGLDVTKRFPVVQGNKIGTNAAGTGPLPNTWAGVLFQTGAVGSIGGTGAGQANVIAYNGRQGFSVQGGTNITFRGNLVHSNGRLAIDIFTKGGTDAGNGGQLPPTLTSVTPGPSTTAISGTVTSDKAGPVLVDVYATNQCQAAYGTGEAKQFLGTISVPYAGGGVTTAFSGSVANSSVGSVITATSTVAANGTSQFSACLPFSDLQITAVDSQDVAAIGDDVATLFTVTNNGPNAASGIAVPIGAGGGPQSANDEGWLDAPSQGSIAAGIWTIGTLASGASATVCARGDIVRKEFTLVLDEDVELIVPAYFSPGANVNELTGVADPFRGNNFASGEVTVGTATPRNGVCPLPTLSIDDASLTRPASGTAPMTFTVRLSKAQTRPVTVRYATANGKAVAVEDYVASSGTVTFAAGETTKTVTVPIVGSQSDEPDKAFTVNLSAPFHALVADGSATGTVKANFLLQGCPPGSTANQRFVCHLYFDALGRAPESGGFTFWVNRLNNGTPRATMAKSYLTQPESLRKVANRAYVLYLGRNGTATELSGWATKLANKTATTQDIRIAVLASNEYFTKVGSTNEKYIRQMFLDVFRRNVDASGLAYWTGQLTSGKTRTNVATRFMAEPEGRRKIVGDIYLRFLRREPTTTEANGWVSQLAAGKTEVDVGIGLVASTEYYTRPSS
jgi:CSLREA domain-containing protein